MPSPTSAYSSALHFQERSAWLFARFDQNDSTKPKRAVEGRIGCRLRVSSVAADMQRARCSSARALCTHPARVLVLSQSGHDGARSRAKFLATHFRATVNARALGAFPPAVRFHQGTSRI
jgi:hypothetical protein